MKVLVYSFHEFERRFLEFEAKGHHELTFTEQKLFLDSVPLAKGYDGIAIFTSDIASAAILEALHGIGIRFISLRSVGFDHVDIRKAQQLGIKVANVPEYSPYSVAEFAATLLMSVNRKIVKASDLFRKNDFRLDDLIGMDLYGKTIGVIGTGKIGTAFAYIMHGFGCKLIAYDIQKNEEIERELGIQYLSLSELCSKSDVISIHCPLNENTRHMFSEALFRVMKESVILVNTSRGAVIHTKDLITALENNKIGGAGLDVYEFEKGLYFGNHQEEGIDDNVFQKLRSFPNVLLTGHQGFLTTEALQGIAATTIHNFDCWGKQIASPNELVPN